MSRMPRSTTDRASTSNRPMPGKYGKSYLHVDVDKLDNSCEYIWATETVRQQDANDNIRQQMATRGFVPVTCGELPSEAPLKLHGDPSTDPEAPIRRGGLVLMKRPAAYADDERVALAQDNAAAVRAVKREHSQRHRNEYFREDAGSHVTERQEVRGGKFPDA